MILCPRGHPNPDGKTTCVVCNEYIDSSEEVQTALQAVVVVPDPPVLFLEPSRVALGPDQDEASIGFRMSNPNATADEYRLEVTGDSSGWTTVDPATLRVAPGSEASARVHFRPPPGVLARPGTAEFGVRATSLSVGLSGVVTGTIEVAGFSRLSATLAPQSAEDRASTEHTVTLVNEGTLPVAAGLQVAAAEDGVTVDVRPSSLTVPPGASATAQVVARARRRRLLGSDVSHPFRVVASGGPAPVALDGVMVQRATPMAALALGLIPLVLLVLVAVALFGGGGGGGGGGTPPTTSTTRPKPTYVQEVESDRPIRWFRLDDTTGNVARDSSASGANGTYVGNPVKGVAGALPDNRAVTFDGVNDRVDIVGVSLAGDFTLEAWVRLANGIGNADAIVGRNGPGQDVNFFQGRLRLFSGTRDFLVATQPTAAGGDFTHFVVTRIGNNFRLFINGQLNTTDSQMAIGPNSFGVFRPLTIGRGNAGFLAGQIDELAIYNFGLAPDRVRAHFEASGRT